LHAWAIRPGDELAVLALQDPEKLRCRRVLVLSAEYKGQSSIGAGLPRSYFQVEVEASSEDKKALEATALRRTTNGQVEPYLGFVWRSTANLAFPYTFDADLPWLKKLGVGTYIVARMATPSKDLRKDMLPILAIDKSGAERHAGVHVVLQASLEQLTRLLDGVDANGRGKIEFVPQ
jgi:hypothetical protein